jgi:hypothetical protein
LKLFEQHLIDLYALDESIKTNPNQIRKENPHEALCVLAMLDKFCQSMISNYELLKELK